VDASGEGTAGEIVDGIRISNLDRVFMAVNSEAGAIGVCWKVLTKVGFLCSQGFY
jgi:hypothetical protein